MNLSTNAKRKLWLLLGWSSLLGNLGDGTLALCTGAVVFLNPAVDLDVTVEAFLKDHVTWLYWVKAVATSLLPQPAVTWLFELPALVYFPTRVVMGTLVGWWAFRQAKDLASEPRPASTSPKH
jgi:hypothetical protein